MDNIIINFSGNTDGLKPVEDGMDNLIKKEGEVGDTWKRVSELMNAQVNGQVDSTSNLYKAIVNLANASKTLDKSIIGGAYTEYLKQIQQQLALTNDEVIAYVESSKKAAQEAIFSAKTQEEADELTRSIEVMNSFLELFTQHAKNAANAQNELGGAFEENADKVSASTDGVSNSAKSATTNTEGLGKAFSDAADDAGQFESELGKIDKAIAEFSQMGVEGVKKLNALMDELLKRQQNIRAAMGRTTNPKELKVYEEALAAVNKGIADVGTTLDYLASEGIKWDEFEEPIPEVTEKVKTLAAELANIRDQMGKLALEGKQDSEEFKVLFDRALAIKKQIEDVNNAIKRVGSNTSKLNGLIEIATGAAAGYAVVQGVISLIGDESEETQRALLKVNAAMSILQGFQTLQNILQKDSAASLLFKTSATAANTAATVANTAATTANAAAQGTQAAAATVAATATGAQTVATEGAVVAQTQLNTAMALNPVGIVIAGIIALTAAISMWNGVNKTAIRIQEDANYALYKAGDSLEDWLQKNQNATNKAIAEAKKRGASSVELAKIEGQGDIRRLELIDKQRVALGKLYNEQQKEIERRGNVDKETLEAHAKLLDRQLALDKQYQNERAALEVKHLDFQKEIQDRELRSFIAQQEAKVLATRTGSVAEMKAQIEAIKATRAAKDKLNPDATQGEKEKAAAEDSRAISDIELAIYAYYLKSATAMAEANVAQRKKLILSQQVDSIASIKAVMNAEIAAIRARVNEQIKSNPNISAGERAKIQAEANLQILELEKQFAGKQLEIKQAGINAELILARKGTQEEYDLKIRLLNSQREIELAATEVTEAKRKEINAKYQKQREDALRAFNEAQLQNQISYLNADAEAFGLTENQKLEITLKRVEVQRQLETSQAEGNAAKIAEINAKYDALILNQKKSTIQANLAENIKALDVFTEESLKRQQRIAASQYSSGADKVKALEALKAFENEKLDIQHRALTTMVEQGLITNSEFEVQYQEILNKRADIERDTQEKITAVWKAETDKRLALYAASFEILKTGIEATLGESATKTALLEFQNAFQVVQGSIAKLKAALNDPSLNATQKAAARLEAFKEEVTAIIAATQVVINQMYADQSAARQQALSDQLAMLEEQKQKELDNKNLTEQQKADIDEKYRQRERQERIRAFNAEKEAKRTQAIINGLLGVTQAIATNPFPYSLIVAAIVAASTAVQVAKINSQPVPRFRTGKKKGGYEGFGIVDDGGKIEPILRSDGTLEIASGTPKNRLTYLHRDDIVFPSMEHMYKHFSIPAMPDIPEHLVGGREIDYDRLAEAMAAKMAGVIPAPKSTHVNIDKDGIKTLVVEGGNQTEVKNTHITMD
ncbi:hypothetical protein JMG10_07620 [Nostoc ellipsosporum NOK]|nr:hypothetical protein [Nostoc ellipsosporum NOK]